MKNRFYSLAVVFSFFFSPAWSQNENDNEMPRLMTQCQKILELSRQIDSLKNSLTILSSDMQTMREEWRKTCTDYMASDYQTPEDYDYLINHTDTVFDGVELYKQLVEASLRIKGSDGVRPTPVERSEPRPAVGRNPVEPEEEEMVAPKEEERKDERGKKAEDKPDTPPAGKKSGDMDKDLKSRINKENGKKGENGL